MRRLPVILLAMLTVFLTTAALGQEPSTNKSVTSAPMTNADVMNLVSAGLSNEVIVNAVRDASARQFDLSASGLLALKKAKVADAIIVAMQDATKVSDGATSAKPVAAPAVDHHGLYWREHREGDKVPEGSYLDLASDGTFQLFDAQTRTTDKGTYRVVGPVIDLIPSPPPASKLLFQNPKGTMKIEAGILTEPDSGRWKSFEIINRNRAADEPSNGTLPAAEESGPPGCNGIELLGLYKQDLVDRQMGGGLVDWVVKIRNNTNVTRIIKFGWIDEYGQQQVAQIQLRGGDIATQRLDLTQGRYIPPVKDPKLITCQ